MTPEERKALENQVLWNSGGYGYGICRMAGMDFFGSMRPGPDRPDWPSIVAVSGQREKYTDEEIEKIAAFSKRVTANYDKVFSWRMGANLIILDKQVMELSEGTNVSWMRKRQSWEYGAMFSPTLDEALAVFAREAQEG